LTYQFIFHCFTSKKTQVKTTGEVTPRLPFQLLFFLLPVAYCLLPVACYCLLLPVVACCCCLMPLHVFTVCFSDCFLLTLFLCTQQVRGIVLWQGQR
jgi:hypothetical protein